VSGARSERAGTGPGAGASGSEVVTAAAPLTPHAPAVLSVTASAAPPAALQAAPRMTRSALARAQSSAGEIVPRLQYQLARLGPAGQTGLVALVAALVFAASTLLPARHALESLSADLARAQHPSGAQSPDQAVPRLVESLPTRAQIPAVIGLIYAEASKSGVPLDVGHYSYSSPKAGTLGRYDVEFPVKAGYPQIRTFINGTLTAVPAAALDKLHVERKTVGDASVSANIGFVIYVRSE
jgi:hypothetical protein